MTSRKTIQTLRDRNQSKKSRSRTRGRKLFVEHLEDRRLLAVVSWDDGTQTLKFDAGAGETNTVNLSYAANTFTISDTGVAPTLGTGIGAGANQLNCSLAVNTVTCPDADNDPNPVLSVAITLGDQTDSFTLGTYGYGGTTVDGGGNSDTFIGPDVVNSWSITAADAGTVAGVGFTNFANLTGGTGADTFTFTNAGSVSGAVDGGAGTDTLVGDADGNAFVVTGANAGTLTGKTSGWSNIENLTGGAGVDTFTINSGATLSGNIDGAGGSDTLTQADGTNAWNINSANGGTVTDVTGTFSNIENLTGGSGADTFTFTNAGSVSGAVDGGCRHGHAGRRCGRQRLRGDRGGRGHADGQDERLEQHREPDRRCRRGHLHDQFGRDAERQHRRGGQVATP